MQLIKYDAACKAVAEIRNIDEAKGILDKMIAIQTYGRQAKNRQLEIDAAEIRMRAERRLGQMLAEQKASGGMNKGMAGSGRPSLGGTKTEPPKDTTPTLSDLGIDKKLSSKAQKVAAVPEEKFEGMIAEWRDRIEVENDRVTTNLLREGSRAERDQGLPKPALTQGTFDLILADPPWRYEHVKTQNRAIENQYPTMSLEEICDLNVPAADNCILFLWATSPKLAESMCVIESWGFVYRTCAVWDKERIGMGYYFRQQHELLLVATKGSPGTPDESERVSSVIRSPRGVHSEKPVAVYELIEKMYPNTTRIELFCRLPREGWSAWGNQANAV